PCSLSPTSRRLAVKVPRLPAAQLCHIVRKLKVMIKLIGCRFEDQIEMEDIEAVFERAKCDTKTKEALQGGLGQTSTSAKTKCRKSTLDSATKRIFSLSLGVFGASLRDVYIYAS